MEMYWILVEFNEDEPPFAMFIGSDINEANRLAAEKMIEGNCYVYVVEQLEVYNPKAA